MEEFDEIRGLISRVVDSNGKAARSVYDRYKAILTKYQEQPQLLDGCLESIVQPLAVLLRQAAMQSTAQDTANVQDVCRLLHVLITVRGYKTVVRFFPHEAADLERVLQVFEYVRDTLPAADITGDSSSIALWEAQAVLMLWLSILVLMPFDLFILDSAVTTDASPQQAKRGYTPLAAKIMELCQEYLKHPGAVREMAALLLARLLTRPDMAAALQDFITWQQQALASTHGPAAVFLLPGILQTLALIFKIGRREQLLQLAPRIWLQLADLLGEEGSTRGNSSSVSCNMLARKLAVKLVQRVGLTLLPPQLAGWRYVRSAADLGRNLGLGSDRVSETSTAAVTAAEAAEEVPPQDPTVHEVPEQIEDLIGVLLASCSDKDTVVRWSAAKGVARLAGCLPLELAEEVVDGVLASLSPSEPDTSWHGGCLAIAELARRSILAPDRLESVTGLLQQALAYDVRRGPHSVGAHVRDAAAYVCWALARAYDPSQLTNYVNALASSLLVVACYDREVNCRRAAASAFQECVGRLGSFPHGLEILAVADYYSVGNVSSAYLRVAPFIASFPEYTAPLLDHLLMVKLRHWDKALRSLAAMALAALAPVATQQLADSALPRLLGLVTSDILEVRTGAVLGIAELLPALPAAGLRNLNNNTGQNVTDVLTQLESAGMYRGKGGELMREASARLIEQIAAAVGGLAVVLLLSFAPSKRHQAEQDMAAKQQQRDDQMQFAFSAATESANPDADEDRSSPVKESDLSYNTSPKQQQQQQRIRLHLPLTDQYYAAAARVILDCLSHVLNNIQASGVSALKAHARACQLAVAEQQQQQQVVQILHHCCDRLRDREVLPAARKGAAAALGVLPRGLIRDQAGELLSLLANTAQKPLDPITGFDIETRIAAISSLGQLTLELLGTQTTHQSAATSLDPPAAAAPCVAAAVITDFVCPTLLAALHDYTIDNRGDVGSWVREAAMDGLAQITLTLEQMVQQQQQNQSQQQEQQQEPDPAELIAQGAAALHLEGSGSGTSQTPAAAAVPAAAASQHGQPGWSPVAVQQIHHKLSLLLINGLLRQALERIARLREAAILHLRSLLSQPLTAAVVPGAAAITAALPADAAELAGVASLACVARFAALLKLPWYRLALLEGLVACIGGVDAGLAKAAGSALLSQLEDCSRAAAGGGGRGGEGGVSVGSSEDLRRSVGGLLLTLWQQHTGSARLSFPLIKTAALLISHADFAAVQVSTLPPAAPAATVAADSSSGSSTFAWGVLQLLKLEIKGCGDVAKLLEGASLMAQLACVDGCSDSAIQSVMVLLVNRFPKVRRYMAEQLYIQMLSIQAEPESEDPAAESADAGKVFAALPTEDLEAALDVLLVSPWDGPIEQVRAAREELAAHLHVEIKTRRIAKASEDLSAWTVPKQNTAENESYQSLLDDAARGGGY